jgi:hypothetical protein
MRENLSPFRSSSNQSIKYIIIKSMVGFSFVTTLEVSRTRYAFPHDASHSMSLRFLKVV